MRLKSLYVRNFRNFKELYLEFGDRMNLFLGRNAQGKTNLLEAIILLSTGRSFRTEHLSDLIYHKASSFFLEARIECNQVIQMIRLSFDGKCRELECNSTKSSSFTPLLGQLPSCLYAPTDLELIAGPPALRRRFLNLHLTQSDPLYVHHLLRFHRALKQRNILLKTKQLESISCWEEEMAASSLYLVEKRRLLTLELNDLLPVTTRLLCGEAIHLEYHPSQSELYLAEMQKNRAREQMMGFTLTGPHRDDLDILVDQKPAHVYASEGQKRTALFALRLAEWHRLEKRIEAPPLFAIDDLELHLDRERQVLFQKAVEGLGQVFITSPQSPPLREGVRFFVSAGEISDRPALTL